MGGKNLLTSDDVPVLLIGYNRPELLEKRIYELSDMPIKHLYISIDGGDSSHTDKMNLVITKASVIFKDLHTLEIHHNRKNLGLVKHVTSAITEVFKNFQYIIVIEDDVVTSQNFFENMIDGFNVLKLHKMYGIVGAFSPLDLSRIKHLKNYWRITRYTPLWGWGCSKTIWDRYNYNLSQIDIAKNLNKSEVWNRLTSFQKNIWLNRFYKSQENPFASWDMQFQYLSFVESFNNIVPISRLVDNEGFLDPRAVHTKGAKPKWLLIGKQYLGKIESPNIFKFSSLINNVIDSNLLAGDTKIIKTWNTLRFRK